MNTRLLSPAVGAMLLATASLSPAHEEAAGTGRLGTVHFATTCSPAVQAQFERAVAMLHSFWYTAAEATFRDVLAKDPGCAIAAWGIAAILMSNPLAGSGASPQGAAAAQAAIAQ